ncbi:MAG: metal-dependent hydrolase [Candidatus Thorarchaeota archaeon]
MTYAPTHFALAGLFVWVTMGEKKRKEFSERKKGHFLLLNFVTVIPDFDFVFFFHRGPSHSLFGPIILLLIGIISRRYLANKRDDLAFYGDMIILAAVFWQLHIILDLGFGPTALFWPVSEEYYSFWFDIETSIKPVGFLPFIITGFKMGVDRLSPEEGRLTYVYNWSTEERIAKYGSEPVVWGISDIFFHILIFLVWTMLVGRKLIPTVPSSWLATTKVKEYFSLLQNRLAILAVLIIFLAFAVGPMQGEMRIENEKSYATQMIIGPREFSPAIWVNIDLDQITTGTAIVEINKGGTGMLGLVQLPQKEVQNISTTLFEGWNRSLAISEEENSTSSLQSISMAPDFPTNYSEMLQTIKSKTNYLTSSLDGTRLGPMALNSGEASIFVYVHTWDLTSFQSGPWVVRILVNTITDRTLEYAIAGLIGLFGASLLFIPIVRYRIRSS